MPPEIVINAQNRRGAAVVGVAASLAPVEWHGWLVFGCILFMPSIGFVESGPLRPPNLAKNAVAYRGWCSDRGSIRDKVLLEPRHQCGAHDFMVLFLGESVAGPFASFRISVVLIFRRPLLRAQPRVPVGARSGEDHHRWNAAREALLVVAHVQLETIPNRPACVHEAV
jgi:hypothetical protein